MRSLIAIILFLLALFFAFCTAIPIVDKGAGRSGRQARAKVTFEDRVSEAVCWGSATVVLLSGSVVVLVWKPKKAR